MHHPRPPGVARLPQRPGKNCLYGLGNFAEASKYGADQPRCPTATGFGRPAIAAASSHRSVSTRPRSGPTGCRPRTTESPAVRSGISPVFHGWVQTVSGVFTSLGVVATLCVLIVEQRRYRADQRRARSDQTRLVLPLGVSDLPRPATLSAYLLGFRTHCDIVSGKQHGITAGQRAKHEVIQTCTKGE